VSRLEGRQAYINHFTTPLRRFIGDSYLLNIPLASTNSFLCPSEKRNKMHSVDIEEKEVKRSSVFCSQFIYDR
jgi:hypothetical protein